MPLYDKLKELFAKKERREKVDSLKDIQAIIEFLEDTPKETAILRTSLKKLEELEHEAQVANEKLLVVNLETQAKILDHLLERFEFYQNDVAISGIRMKKVADEFLKRARLEGLRDLVKERKNNPKWKFYW